MKKAVKVLKLWKAAIATIAILEIQDWPPKWQASYSRSSRRHVLLEVYTSADCSDSSS